MIRIGAFGILLGALSMLVPALFHYINTFVIAIPMMIVMLSFVSSTLISFFSDNNQLPLAGFLLVFGLLSIMLARKLS
jgi:hypothetical protein